MRDDHGPAYHGPVYSRFKDKQNNGSEPSLIGSGAASSRATSGGKTPSVASQVAGGNGSNGVKELPIPASGTVTYGDLKQFHRDRNRFDESDNERPRRYFRNHDSAINSWTKRLLGKLGSPIHEGAGDLLPVGDELVVNFIKELSRYLENQEKDGKSKSTLNDRKSIMWAVRESALEMLNSAALPPVFSDALSLLISSTGLSVYGVSKAVRMSHRTLFEWSQGSSLPTHASLPMIERLEDYFKLARGVLTGRLEHLILICRPGPIQVGTTPWREHQRTLIKHRYGLKELPKIPESEFADLTAFYTDDAWLEVEGFERNSEWVVWEENGYIPSRSKFDQNLRCFLGYLNLPVDGDTPLLTGKGLPLESLSMACLSNAEMVLGYVEFLRQRTHSKSYNGTTVAFLSICASFLRPKTGFLWQQPHYGGRLPEPVPEHEWHSWCEKNRKKLLNFLKKRQTSKNHQITMTRDPFAAVRHFMEDLQHPVSVLMEMVGRMKRMIPFLEKGDPVRLALLHRDIAFAEFITSYPLRARNWSWMTWVPKNSADVYDPHKTYIETEEGSNLYQKPDGTWWLRFPLEGVKNRRKIDVPVALSVVPSLVNYLRFHRPVLNEALIDMTTQCRAKFGLPALTTEEKRQFELNPFVLRPSPQQVSSMSLKRLTKEKGLSRMSEAAISQCMFRMSQKYIPGCKGFCAHAVRHLVASEHIRNNPHGFAEAAAVLNDTEETVRKHYAWIRSCDQIRPWHEYHESLRRQFGSLEGSMTEASMA